MKCGKRSLAFLLSLVLSQSLFGQSYVDTKTYQVTGKQLNELVSNWQIVKDSLEKQKLETTRLSNLLNYSQAESVRLTNWLKASQAKEQELTQQLVKLNAYYKTLKEELAKSNADEIHAAENEALLWGLALGAGSVLLLNMMLSGGR